MPLRRLERGPTGSAPTRCRRRMKSTWPLTQSASGLAENLTSIAENRRGADYPDRLLNQPFGAAGMTSAVS
jgi:hypothetical protein